MPNMLSDKQDESCQLFQHYKQLVASRKEVKEIVAKEVGRVVKEVEKVVVVSTIPPFFSTKHFDAILQDALASPRLSNWEESFIQNLASLRQLQSVTSESDLSHKQLTIWRQIERKIYDVG